MNKTLLLIIVDFLFLNLIALTRWEKAEPARVQRPPVPALSANAATKDQDLVEVMRQSLTDEQAARQQLQQRLAAQDTTLSAREQSVAQLQGERSRLASDLAETRKAEADLGQKFTAASQEASLSREQLERLQRELDEKRGDAERARNALAELEKQQAAARKQIEGLTVAVAVGEQEKQHLQQEASQLQGQVQTERSERIKVEQSANQLAQGVGQLAQNSGELSKEIRDNRPISANVLFSDFQSNHVQATFTLRRKGLFGEVVHKHAAPTVFTTDGRQVYAIFHVEDTGFSYDGTALDWEKLGIALDRPPEFHSDGTELRFLAADPRIVAVPVDAAQVAALGAKVYPLAADPFRFPEAVLINGQGKGYGDVAFKLDPDHTGYVRVDNRLLKRLFGDFAPSRGDLVLSKNGELLGLMVNSDYCALLNQFDALETLRAGDIAAAHPAELINSLGARVRGLPLDLQ
jgi:hypothetical protein